MLDAGTGVQLRCDFAVPPLYFYELVYAFWLT